MKKALVIFFTAVLLLGCKGTQSKGASNAADPGLGGLIVPGERVYTASELQIGRRICSALKAKREFFEKLPDLQEKFRFRGELRNCDNPNPYNNSEFIATISNAGSSNIEYVATNRSNYFKDVMTDQSNAMKILCDNLAVSDSVSNTNLSGSSYLIINLLISGGFDRFEISKKSKDANGNFPLASIEGVNVFTRANQVAVKFFGVEQERTRYSSCAGSSNSSYIKQTWVSAVTNF